MGRTARGTIMGVARARLLGASGGSHPRKPEPTRRGVAGLASTPLGHPSKAAEVALITVMAFHLPARRPRNNDPLRRRAGIQEAHCAVRPKEDSAGRGNRLSEERTRGTPSLYTSGRGGPDLDKALGLMQCMNCFFACFCGVLQLLQPSFTLCPGLGLELL